MSRGILIDTHVLLWLDLGQPMKPRAELAILQARAAGELFLSHITLWEVGVATHKKSLERRPNLRGLTVAQWFQEVIANYGLRALAISPRIAAESAEVPSVYGSGDPGDCFLIATARLRKVSLATHDTRIVKLAEAQPDYLSVIAC